MTTDISSNPAATAGAGTENTGANVENVSTGTESTDAAAAAVATPSGSSAAPAAGADAASASSATPVVGADGKVSYVPNYKYKAALQEKELDPFFHSLVKDPDSEKKVKDLFTKVDAFDFIKTKKEQVEQQLQSLAGDYENVQTTVSRFNDSVSRGDLSSAFRVAGITKEAVFKWTQQQLQLMEMPPEQRQQFEQFEEAQSQKYNLEQQVSNLQKQYEQQAVQARAVQLDVALSRPEVARFSEAWDRNAEPGSFKNFVIEEAKKVYYDTRQDLSPEQAIGMVMQRFGKFLNTGDTVVQSPQAVPQVNGFQQQKPVIPNVAGKAASPIKKVPRSIDDLKKLAKEANT